jgi:hypothetical protein
MTKLAREFGATDMVEERGEAAVEVVKQLTNGVGVDAALECVGTNEAMQTALAIARPGSVVGNIVLWEMHYRLVGYQLVRSDWLWYTLLPLISYSALVVAAILLPIFPGPILFIIAAVTMLLLFTGIHNAWDVVTYMAIERSQPQDTSQD